MDVRQERRKDVQRILAEHMMFAYECVRMNDDAGTQSESQSDKSAH